MKTKINLCFEIECGERTCAYEKGKFCHMLRLSLNGKDSCFLFGQVFDDGSGWIQRHPDCIKLGE